MLAFTRKAGEESIITTPEGRVIRLVVIRVKPDRVVLGWQADDEVRIDRKEVHESRLAAKEGTS